MKKQLLLSRSLFGCLLLSLATPALPQKAQVVTIGYFPTTVISIDVPGAGTGALQGTVAIGVDAAGDVAGTYIDSMGADHGFVCLANGTIDTINVTGAGAGAGQGTVVTGIDSVGNIVGYYIPANGQVSGFVRATDGTINTIVVFIPTFAYGINSLGAVTGWVGGGSYAGFVLDPGSAGTLFYDSSGDETYGIAINTAGTVSGMYLDASHLSHGFVRSADGTTVTNFDPP